MRPDKFTQKMQEALQAAQNVAAQFHQQEITNEQRARGVGVRFARISARDLGRID
jgi:hypothetical protein